MKTVELVVIGSFRNDSDHDIRMFLECACEEVYLSPGHEIQLLARPTTGLLPVSIAYSDTGLQIYPRNEFDPDWHILFCGQVIKASYPTRVADLKRADNLRESSSGRETGTVNKLAHPTLPPPSLRLVHPFRSVILVLLWLGFAAAILCVATAWQKSFLESTASASIEVLEREFIDASRLTSTQQRRLQRNLKRLEGGEAYLTALHARLWLIAVCGFGGLSVASLGGAALLLMRRRSPVFDASNVMPSQGSPPRPQRHSGNSTARMQP
ncbi:hypothetical protein [Chitinolyticbacter albus]|uniref:hypothetical protein n=1 Tax=Chitinolyticbacter albus TaxID=2961951 RepID=UPI00210EC3B5|nr:hypothetical protein [Chitinolyticbacter albus]